MRIEAIQLKHQNRMIIDYLNKHDSLKSFVDYPTFDLEQRLKDLREQSFDRNALTKVLQAMNKKWKAPKETLENIERLKQHDSVVVIGGQQAGLLTGPLYTVNKIISIIKLAKEQEVTLQVPVVTVFWIAGEDHDFAEINHIFSYKDQNVYKQTIKQQEINKRAITD